MADVIPALVLNQILTSKSLSIVKKYNLQPEFFPGYENEFNFILKEHEKYGTVPDVPTVLANFTDFNYFPVSESEHSLVDKLMEEVGFAQIITSLHTINDYASTKSTLYAAEYMLDKAKEIINTVRRIKTPSYDLVKEASSRLDEYKKRVALQGVIGIPSGIPDLDRVTKGWRDVDYVTIAARTEEGKSWILLYLLMNAWLSGKRVLMFDLENDPHTVTGFRFDSFMAHFSNEGLMDGAQKLDFIDEKDSNDYAAYIDSLSKYEIPFVIKDQRGNGGEKYTPKQIEAIIEEEKPDIIGIDQISLVAPSKQVRSIREGYVSVTQEFRQMTLKMRIPILQNSQVSRESAKAREKNKESTPEIHQLSESDSVGQDSTRILTLRMVEDGLLKISVKKNTYGRSNQDCMVRWEIDHGIIKPISRDKTF